ncbi:MAG: GNAT family N-acetyltransferase [Rhodoferax sp.]|uniref:GNAT family N-acetyltransferase n=1 Tax=Rhodoferax sp. TaxID=50421 RepID=UPI0026243D4C|nr:GNAT family N-acetyltransferase [Rhodoferax sp.]MDD2881474.1 GNAT family N-acetyltransferase [Rhodoferax sp.]
MDVRRSLHQGARKAFSFLPRNARFAIYRSFVACDANPDPRLVLKIAETKEELEACFRLLHDAYVASGFMTPDPSGMRATIYHALPTTTTLCAKFDGEVVGTISLIRESLFGFPLQAIFDLNEVRTHKGNIAEVSALAVHPKFRKTGGTILFPLMKFMYDYCTTFFDTRHLVIAVNPNRIEMYESLLFFQRLAENFVANYDFANGAPAVGASLDLHHAPEVFKLAYGHKKPQKNLYQYFVKTVLPNIVVPNRRYYTTNDPVMTPELLDYFFNQRTQVFANLEDRKKGLLHDIYNLETYQSVLPKQREAVSGEYIHRQHERYSVKCPGTFELAVGKQQAPFKVMIIELSAYSFQATSSTPLPLNAWGEANIQLGQNEKSHVKVMVISNRNTQLGTSFTFKLSEPDLAWRKFFNALNAGITHEDLENATRFLPQ